MWQHSESPGKQHTERDVLRESKIPSTANNDSSQSESTNQAFVEHCVKLVTWVPWRIISHQQQHVLQHGDVDTHLLCKHARNDQNYPLWTWRLVVVGSWRLVCSCPWIGELLQGYSYSSRHLYIIIHSPLALWYIKPVMSYLLLYIFCLGNGFNGQSCPMCAQKNQNKSKSLLHLDISHQINVSILCVGKKRSCWWVWWLFSADCTFSAFALMMIGVRINQYVIHCWLALAG